ncbi:MAG: Uncharacterised protein [Halieaceae bacterium]|nr:MAG: Uncharacterised protein [Halieaceae bacterium]
MALCRKVHNSVCVVVSHDLRDQVGVTDITLGKANAAGLLQRFKAETITRIGQRIQHHHCVVRVSFGPMVDEVHADEPRPARDHQ